MAYPQWSTFVQVELTTLALQDHGKGGQVPHNAAVAPMLTDDLTLGQLRIRASLRECLGSTSRFNARVSIVVKLVDYCACAIG